MPTVVDPSVLFSKYSYVTGASEPMVGHFRSYAETAIREFVASPSDLVIDIGGNDAGLFSSLIYEVGFGIPAGRDV